MQTSIATAATLGVAEVATIPVAKIAPWAVLTALVAALVYFFVGAELGATALFAGSDLHEFVHDARHLLGFPCH
jgi:hypothetical protein